MVVGQQVAGRRAADRTGERGRIVVFEAALVLGPVGVDEVAGKLELGHTAVDAPAGVGGVVVAVANVALVLAVLEVVGGEGGIVLGRFAIAQAGLLLGVVASLDVEPEQHPARTERAAVIEPGGRFDLAVVIAEPARAEIAAIERERVAQNDVERTRDRIAGAPGRGRTDDLDLLDQFGGDAVEEE